MVDLRESAPTDSCDKAAAKRAAVPCVEALIYAFNIRWGSNKNVLMYRKGKRHQPEGFQPGLLMATALTRAHEDLVRDWG